MSLNTFSEMAEDAALNLYLQHSGVKGMSWGSNRWWTPDKKLTPEGRKHYGYGEEKKNKSGEVDLNDDGRGEAREKLIKATKKYANSVEHPGFFIDRQKYWSTKIRNSPIMREIADNIKASKKEVKKAMDRKKFLEDLFYNDERLYNKYLQKTIDNAIEDYEKHYGKASDEQRKQIENSYRRDDGDQGEAYQTFLKSGNWEAIAHREAELKAENASAELHKTVEKFVNEYVGYMGNERLPNEWRWSNDKFTINDLLSMKIVLNGA